MLGLWIAISESQLSILILVYKYLFLYMFLFLCRLATLIVDMLGSDFVWLTIRALPLKRRRCIGLAVVSVSTPSSIFLFRFGLQRMLQFPNCDLWQLDVAGVRYPTPLCTFRAY